MNNGYKFIQKENALKPGIYFGLDDGIYHRDSAISRSTLSALKDLTPFEVWLNSWLNPSRDMRTNPENDAAKFGRYYHMYLLEQDRFQEHYRVSAMDKYNPNKESLTRDQYEFIKFASRAMMHKEKVKQYLSNGIPEVTIVHADPRTGHLIRTRHDYFKINMTIDIKSIRDLKDRTIKNHIYAYHYAIQEYLYMQARKVIRVMLRQGTAHIYGDCSERFLEAFMKVDPYREAMIFIPQKKDFPYPLRTLHLSQRTREMGEDDAMQLIDKYIFYLQEYGKEPWPLGGEDIEEFDIFEGAQKIEREDEIYE